MSADVATHPADDQLDAYAASRTDAAATDLIARHLETCRPCKDRLAQRRLMSTAGRYRNPGDTSAPPPSVQQTDRGTPDQPRIRVDDRPSAGPDLQLGDDYKILQELGRGGMGVVYLVRNKLMDRLEVVKVMLADWDANSDDAKRFVNEIQAVAKLKHPNVVTAHAVLRPNKGKSLALAMEHVEGTSLQEVIRTQVRLTVLRACNYAAQAASGLQHAHEEGLCHRDIKPGNLMVTKVKNRTVVKILDFGLAKVKVANENTDLTKKNVMMGSPGYVAPEQAQNAAKADIRADIYSLGCTLYHMLAGRMPFEGDPLGVVLQHVNDPPPPLQDLRPDVPDKLWAVIQRMMAKDPADRYQTPEAVVTALRPFLNPAPAQTGPKPAPPPSPSSEWELLVPERPEPPRPPAVEPEVQYEPVLPTTSRPVATPVKLPSWRDIEDDWDEDEDRESDRPRAGSGKRTPGGRRTPSVPHDPKSTGGPVLPAVMGVAGVVFMIAWRAFVAAGTNPSIEGTLIILGTWLACAVACSGITAAAMRFAGRSLDPVPAFTVAGNVMAGTTFATGAMLLLDITRVGALIYLGYFALMWLTPFVLFRKQSLRYRLTLGGAWLAAHIATAVLAFVIVFLISLIVVMSQPRSTPRKPDMESSHRSPAAAGPVRAM